MDVGLLGLPVSRKTRTAALRSFMELGWGIAACSRHPAEAVKLIQYLTEGPGLTSLMTNFIVVPGKIGFQMDSSLLTTQRAKDGYALLEKLVNNPASDRNNLSALSAQIGNEIHAMITKNE